MNIKSYIFLKDLYKFLVKQENQGVFVINFFNAAGSQFFTLPSRKAQRQTTYLENERHYIKDRSLLPEMKESFPKPIEIKQLSLFIENNLKAEKLRDCMSHFGVPVNFEENKSYLSKVLATQFQIFVDSDNEDVENVIPIEYEKINRGISNSEETRYGALYKGDDCWVEEQNKDHNVHCYEKFTHEWIIHNSRTINWSGRKLVFKNSNEVKPRAMYTEIQIPDVESKKYIKIATEFDVRSFEGKFICEWEMRDSQDNVCFTFNSRFDVIINVSYKLKTEE